MICIVGHGPRLSGAGLGEKIDAHDKVIRLKNCLFNNPDYGSKIDALCASTEVPGCFRPGIDNFAYPKNGWFIEAPIAGLGFKVMVPLNLCNMWNHVFRQLGGRHQNVSTGMAAIIICANQYRPSQIVLAGFDTLMDPSIQFSRNDAVPRTGVGEFPDHDWETEHKLLTHIEQAYKLKISQLTR